MDIPLLRAIGAACFALGCARSIPTPERFEPVAAEAAAEDVVALRELVIAGDGEAALKVLPEAKSSRARAWRVCAAVTAGRVDDARAWAEAFDREDPWSTFAWGCVLHAEESPEALTQTAWGMKGLAGHEDMVWLRARVLDREGEDEALLELHRTAKLREPMRSEVDLVVADSLAGRDWLKKDGSLAQALELAAAVRARRPSLARAYTMPARWLMRVRRAGEARPIVEAGVKALPDDRRVRMSSWRVLLADPDLDAAQRRTRIEPEVHAMVERDGDDPRALFDAAEMYGRIGLEGEREAMWSRIEREHAGSETAGYVAWERIDALNDAIRLQEKADPRLVAELKQRVKRATAADHRPAMWRGRAYIALFIMLQREGESVDASELLEAVNGMAAHDKDNPHMVYGEGPRTLAQRTPHLRRALELVEAGFADWKTREFDDADEKRSAKVDLHVTRALVLAEAKRFDEAERELAAAEASGPPDVRTFAARGKVAEKRGDLDGARAHWIAGLLLEANQRRRPCSAELERVYVEVHGGRRGLDRYMQRLHARAKVQRKAKILAERLDGSRTLAPFELQSVQGRTLKSDALRGKVAVVHFWATWCGPCVVEMKEIDALVAKYARVEDVQIVLVSGDDDREQLRTWLAEHGFAFDTLLDGSYSHAAKIGSWPSTFFLDRAGRVQFEHVGATSDLVEEFSWRIEAVRAKRS